MLIEREELIKKIEETDTSEIIENEMNFKFKDLELIGMHRNRYDEILYYKNDEKIYVIKIINGYVQIVDMNLHNDHLWSFGTPYDLEHYNYNRNIWDK